MSTRRTPKPANAPQDRKLSWPIFRRLFLGYIVPQWRVGLIAVGAMLIYAATEAGFVALIRPLLDDGMVAQDPTVIRFYATLIVGVLILQGVFFFVSKYLTAYVGRKLIKQLRLDVHDRLLALPNRTFDHLSSGQMISRLTYEAEQTSNASTQAAITVFRDGVTVILVFGYMIYLSPWLMLIVGAVLPVIAGLVALINRRFRRISRRIHRAVGGVGTVAEETVHAHTEIKLFGQEARERERFERLNEQNRRQFMKFSVTRFASVPLIRLVVAIALAITLSLATIDAVVETLTPGTIASFIAAMLLLNRPLKHLVKVNADLQKGLTAARGIFEVIDLPAERDSGTRTIDRARGEIQFKDVRFSYDGIHEVLRGINLKAQPGQTVALTGPSGSGKSTLVSLMPRFYEATAGEVHLDGVPIDEYRLADLRRQFAPVNQDITLFNTTIAENIAYGAQGEVTRAEIERAAEIAYARDFIEALPQGFDTEVGEDGTLLSGGQRQRIAIARAVLKDAPILILDEATASLDSESERYIHAAFERLMQGRTAFVIAHRLSTVENADQIVFLEDGRIIERGTHQELLAHNGRYAGLYRMQFEGADNRP
ncbi:lipid A export permease/ATP-binding protein MsbA [Halorhodospira halophila]|uniref:lipid A export permease/ATP-binding protein MsbA n=1 Tax=Halorhodospira halophila TaxID=1053 RepID=UPI0019145010|nr:lipid A export permease/ATP-binding protein MsbA [Halorhodospira halophila]MBK5943072.1 lipid A export permease/ATP-binding protein MsbA [Halorhodospira halophila]